MKKTIRTLQGKHIDFEKLTLQNEKVRAVGNMNVNAVGEEFEKVDVEEKKKRRNKKTFRRQIYNKVFDTPVSNSKKDAEEYAKKMAEEYAKKIEEIVEPTADTSEFFDEADAVMGKAVIQKGPDIDKAVPKEKAGEVSDELLQAVINRKTGGGLASAIAKAQHIEHKPIKSPREQLRASDGVKKI